jgi:hypothetical protein
MKFFKHLFFMEVSPLIRKGKTSTIIESDMLALSSHLDPRNSVFPEEKLDWTTPRGHLWSVVLVCCKGSKIRTVSGL